MQALEERISRGEVILLDGATGTELERRGVPMDRAAWSAAALVTHPDTIRQVHDDYIRAGADIITSNSFSTARHQLEPAGLGDRFRELNQRAVSLAREARDSAASNRPIYVAASLSSIHFEREYIVPLAEAEANFREQAEALAEAGPDRDFLHPEEFGDYDLEPGRRPTGLPGQNFGERVARRRTRPFVQIETERPVPVSQRPGYVHEHGGVQSVELLVSGVTLVDVKPPPRVAGALRGIGLAQ